MSVDLDGDGSVRARRRRRPMGVPIVPRSPSNLDGSLANSDVDEQVALLWGEWADLGTFLDHYRGEASPKAQRREREKVGWL